MNKSEANVFLTVRIKLPDARSEDKESAGFIGKRAGSLVEVTDKGSKGRYPGNA